MITASAILLVRPRFSDTSPTVIVAPVCPCLTAKNCDPEKCGQCGTGVHPDLLVQVQEYLNSTYCLDCVLAARDFKRGLPLTQSQEDHHR